MKLYKVTDLPEVAQILYYTCVDMGSVTFSLALVSKEELRIFFIFLFILNTSIVWKFQFWYHDNLKVQQRTIMKP